MPRAPVHSAHDSFADLSFQVIEESLMKIFDGEESDDDDDTPENLRRINFREVDGIWSEQAITTLRKNKKPLDILLIGAENTGKTELVKKIFKQYNMPLPTVGTTSSLETAPGRD